MESNKDGDIYYITTDCSPSHLFGNLSVTDKSVMYLHNSESQPRVIVVDRNLLKEKLLENLSSYVTKLNSSETNEMIAIKCVNINNSYYVAVGLYGGFKLWSADGNRLLFQIPAKVRTTDKPYAFTAICEYKTNPKSNGWDSIICTDNYGQIFLVSNFGQIFKAKLLYSYDGVTTTSVCSGRNTELIAVGFETGEVYIFRNKNESQVEVAAKLDNINNLPCLSLAIVERENNLLAIGYLNGEVRIHNFSQDKNSNNFELKTTIGAHLRMLTQVISYKDCLITCGDDCFVNIWKLDNESNVTIVGNFELTDKMPVGLSILENDDSVSLLVSCYDKASLALIKNLNI